MNKDIKRFLVCTFTLTWVFWGIIVIANQFNLLQHGTPLSMVFFVLGGIMPAICGIWVKKKYSTKEDYRVFIKSIISVKHHIIWYIMVIGLAFIFTFLPTLYGGAKMEHPLYMVLLGLPIMIIGGGLEEIGWRGLLQPALQKKFSSVSSTLIVSFFWAVWHLPLWFIPGSSQASFSFLNFFITIMALSFLLTIIYSKTKSIFLCIIFHAFINSSWSVFIPNFKLLPVCVTLAFAIVIFLLSRVTINKSKADIKTF